MTSSDVRASVVDERASISGSRRYQLTSTSVGETYQIDVALPANGLGQDHPLTVVYVLDGNTVFGIAAQAARFLQQADGAAPALLVGVGYCLDGVIRPRDAYGLLRMRDFTASSDAGFLATITEARQGRPGPEGLRPWGGADAFLQFLTGELRPFIASQYDVDPARQILVGSSLGGLFSLYAMLKRPGAFAAYGANSPSLWWNEGELFRIEEAFAFQSATLDTELFMSVGGLETEAPWSMLEGVQRLTERLQGRGHAGLTVTSHVFEGETHTSVIPAALSRTLRTLLRKSD